MYRLYALHQAVRVRRHPHGEQPGCDRLREVHQLRQVRGEVPGEGNKVIFAIISAAMKPIGAVWFPELETGQRLCFYAAIYPYKEQLAETLEQEGHNTKELLNNLRGGIAGI